VRGAASRRRLLAAALVAIVLLGASCDQTDAIRAAAIDASEPVTFASDGLQLAGRLFGPDGSTTGVVMAHMVPDDQSAWYPLAASLGDRGYRVLTFNFRGYCPGGDAGCSEGERNLGAAAADVRAAMAALRDDGVTDVALVGASVGGAASIVVSAADDVDVDAVVTLSAPPSFAGTPIGSETLNAVEGATLFIAATGDPEAARAAEAFYNGTGQPKRYEIVTSNDHGTDLLAGNQGTRVREMISSWLTVHLPLRGAS
jgi:predicted alpha/beta-hydrolase family hydrolase